jgi:hypothetical protein
VTLDGLAWAYLLSIAMERTSRRDPSQPCAALRGTGTCPNLSDEASDEGNLLQIDHVEDAVPARASFPVSTNATTFGPQAVSVIRPSPSYRSITAVVVAERENGKLKLSVFRARTSPGGSKEVPRGCAREPVVRHLRAVAFRATMRARAGGRQRGRRARLGLWRPGLRQREVTGVQHDDFPNAFLPPFVRSATIP